MIPSFARETKGSADASKDLSFDAFGTVVEVYCAENDNVKKGDILVAIESMKQEVIEVLRENEWERVLVSLASNRCPVRRHRNRNIL